MARTGLSGFSMMGKASPRASTGRAAGNSGMGGTSLARSLEDLDGPRDMTRQEGGRRARYGILDQ